MNNALGGWKIENFLEYWARRMKNWNFLNNALGGWKIEIFSNNALGGWKIEIFSNNALGGWKIEIFSNNALGGSKRSKMICFRQKQIGPVQNYWYSTKMIWSLDSPKSFWTYGRIRHKRTFQNLLTFNQDNLLLMILWYSLLLMILWFTQWLW